MAGSMRYRLLIAVAAAAVAHAQPLAAQGVPQGSADSGRKLFVDVGCYACHGRVAQGAAATGPRLAPEPVPFAAFMRQLRQPASDMPPYAATALSDQQVSDIYAFLQSLPKSPDARAIPLLSE